MLEKIVKKDMMDAKKVREQEKNITLTMLLSDLQNEAKTKKRKLTETEEIAVVQRAEKTWQQAIDGAKEAGRKEDVTTYKLRKSYVKVYLPVEMTDEEVQDIIAERANAIGIEIRNLMPAVQKRTGGRKNGKVVATMVRTYIEQQLAEQK